MKFNMKHLNDFLQVTITSATTKKSHIPLNEIRDLYAF